MRCSSCGFSVDSNPKFCPECGKKFVAVQPAVNAGEDGLYYCYKHKKETTRVTCGRCERPICTKCSVIGSVGVRCRECAKNRVPIRARGLVHDAGKSPVTRRLGILALFAALFSFLGFGRHDDF